MPAARRGAVEVLNLCCSRLAAKVVKKFDERIRKVYLWRRTPERGLLPTPRSPAAVPALGTATYLPLLLGALTFSLKDARIS